MAHFMRVFTTNQATPTLPTLIQPLDQEGYVLDTYPKKDDPRFTADDWRTVHVSYDERCKSIMLDRSFRSAEDPMFQEEIDEFTTDLTALPSSDAQQKVLTAIDQTKQIFACYIPDDITERGWETVELLLETLLETTGGLLQVDGEGWYDQEGELLLEME